jgi:uncharacterized membrane protein YgaE (UPF0421/DUF939 family)
MSNVPKWVWIFIAIGIALAFVFIFFIPNKGKELKKSVEDDFKDDISPDPETVTANEPTTREKEAVIPNGIMPQFQKDEVRKILGRPNVE